MAKLHVTTRLSLIALCFLCSSQFNFAQGGDQPKFTISISKGSLAQAVEQIDEMEGITLAYDPTILKDLTVDRKTFNNTSLETILTNVLGDDFNVKMDGNYAIIQSVPKTNPNKSLLKTREDIETINIQSLQVFHGEDFKGPTVRALPPATKLQTGAEDSDEGFLPKENAVLEDTTKVDPSTNRHHLIQVSLLPGIGTSSPNSTAVDVNYSFNFLSGRHNSLDGMEFGLIYNRHESHAYGFQFAGFGNYAGNGIRGVQFAGAINRTKGSVRGLQMSGLTNLGSGTLEGVQASFLLNTASDKSIGAQLSFGGNILKGDLVGGQASFVGNVNHGNLNGPQLSMGVNIVSDSLRGVQAGGILNSANHIKGAQLSFGANLAQEKINGIQLGSFNRAHRLSGIQVGFINVVDSLEKGATIGLLNLVKNGKTELGIDHNDVDHVRLTFRTGSTVFYNIYTVGFRLLESNVTNDDNLLINYGFGFGTEKTLKKNFFLNVELVSSLLYNTEDKRQLFNLLNRVHTNIGFRAKKWLAFSGGPVLNIFVTDEFNEETGETSQLGNKNSFFEKQSTFEVVKIWLGYSFSVKF